jgi:hypothetical protein
MVLRARKTPSSPVETVLSGLASPIDVAVDDRAVYVTDWKAHQILKRAK